MILRGATVYPGEGPPLPADVVVEDGRIAEVLPVERADSSLVLCPGFIDLHTHSALRSFEDPFLTPKLAQGFTTEVINPDGLAPAPVAPERRADRQAYLAALEGRGPETWPWTTVAEYLDALDGTRPALDLVPSIGHGAVRDRVLGGQRRAPSPEELAAMRREVREGLEAGARTLSFGLVYLPGAYAETDELVALAEEAAAFGVPLVPHVRNEAAGILEAVREMVEVARRSGASLHVSHLKSLADERLVEPLLALIEDADATFDQYPYGAGCTLLASLLPGWVQEGGAASMLERLRERRIRERLAREVEEGLPGWENLLGTLGPERIVVEGESLAERGGDPVEAVCALLRESGLAAQMVMHYASEEAVHAIARHPRQLVGSDGIFGERPHPRLYGTAPRFLGRFSIREGLVPVGEAIARLTARSADLLGLSDRGRIEPGKRADLVLLDPDRYLDTATYDDPARSPEGVVGVWVAGERVFADGAPTGARPGRVVR